MTNTAIAADFDESLDVESGFSSQVTLDLDVVVDVLSELGNVVLRQILNSRIGIYTGSSDDLAGCFATNTVDIGETDFDSLISRQVDT